MIGSEILQTDCINIFVQISCRNDRGNQILWFGPSLSFFVWPMLSLSLLLHYLQIFCCHQTDLQFWWLANHSRFVIAGTGWGKGFSPCIVVLLVSVHPSFHIWWAPIAVQLSTADPPSRHLQPLLIRAETGSGELFSESLIMFKILHT